MTMQETAIPKPQSPRLRSNNFGVLSQLADLCEPIGKMCASSCILAMPFSRRRKRLSRVRAFRGVLVTLLVTMASASFARGSSSDDQSQGKEKIASHAKIPLCSGQPASSPAASSPSRPPHSVTLSWKRSRPKTKARRDAIKGYYIYRSQLSHDFSEGNRLNSQPLAGTLCIDTDVKPHGTYFYAVRAISADGTPSNFSAQISVVIPSP
jgi:hypothetical protein